MKKGYSYIPEKHSDPLAEYNLKNFYFVVHEGVLMIFEKKKKRWNND